MGPGGVRWPVGGCAREGVLDILEGVLAGGVCPGSAAVHARGGWGMLHAWAGCVRWKADETARLGPLLARLGPLLGRLAPRLARLGPLLSRPVLWSTVVHCAAESLSQPLRGQLGRSALSRSVSLCEVSSDAVRRTAFASLRPLLARALMRARPLRRRPALRSNSLVASASFRFARK